LRDRRRQKPWKASGEQILPLEYMKVQVSALPAGTGAEERKPEE